MYPGADWSVAGLGTPSMYPPAASSCASSCAAFHCSQLDPERFKTEFAAVSKPVLISGLLDNWAANRNWRLDSLYTNDAYAELQVQFTAGIVSCVHLTVLPSCTPLCVLLYLCVAMPVLTQSWLPRCLPASLTARGE